MLLVLSVLVFFSTGVSARYNPSWRWRVAETDNFRVYFPEGSEEFAARTISLADSVYKDVNGYYNVNPRRLPVVLNPGTDSFNGFYVPFQHRISLFETPVSDLKYYGSSTSDIVDMVFTHEYGHFAHITSAKGLTGLLAKIFGPAFAVTNSYSPGWAIEGSATLLETKFTDGGRGRSHYFRGIMRSCADDGELWGLSAMGTSSPFAPPGGRIYLAGYYLVEYLENTFGPGTFAAVSDYQSRHPLGGSARALKQVTKLKPKSIYTGFLKDFSARSDSVRHAEKLTGLPVGRVLASEKFDSFVSHDWSANGSVQAVRKGYGRKNAFLTIDPLSGKQLNEIAIGKLHNIGPFRFPGDDQLLFAETYYHPLEAADLSSGHIIFFDAETKKRTKIEGIGHVFSTDLSPDGATLAVVKRSGMWHELAIASIDGSSYRTLMSETGLNLESPVWSPDGSLVAVTVKRSRNVDIALVDPESGQAELLFATDVHGDGDPAFSPDGRWLVFSSDRQGPWNIYGFERESGRLFRLTAVHTGAFEPKISPDGEFLSFLALRGGVKEIRIMPFRPLDGTVVDVEKGDAFTSNIADGVPATLSSRSFSMRDVLKPFVHMPYISEDRDGITGGVALFGGDPLGMHAYSGRVSYDRGSGRPGYNLMWMSERFWPRISFSLYDQDIENETFSAPHDLWYREQGMQAAMSLNVIHRTVPSTIAAYYEAGVQAARYYDGDGFTIRPERDRTMSIFLETVISRIPDHADRDMLSGWGQSLFLYGRRAVKNGFGDFDGTSLRVSAKQFAPSPIRHHGFEFSAHHSQRSGMLDYETSLFLPRGYSVSDSDESRKSRRSLVVSTEYRFPLIYLDRGIGLNILHAHLFRGSFFADYGGLYESGSGLDAFSANALSSFGATVTAQTSLFSYLPVEIGLITAYKKNRRGWYFGLLVDIWGHNFAMRRSIKKRLLFPTMFTSEHFK